MIEIYCDGSATTADKPGGYGYVVVRDGIKLAEGSGHIPKATNNVAEIVAAISGLEHVLNTLGLSDEGITLVSDSNLALKFATGEYSPRKPHLIPYYCKLRQLFIRAKATTRWVKGHSGDEHNEQCDKLAKAARENKTDERVEECTAPVVGPVKAFWDND